MLFEIQPPELVPSKDRGHRTGCTLNLEREAIIWFIRILCRTSSRWSRAVELSRGEIYIAI